jgi:Mg2+-importing ATPase
VEVDPSQKERIVRALQRTRHAVGFLGDGINDAPALHAADVGISVDHAVDVARESADIVLLQPDLGVLCRGVEEGRRTFANTLKYISLTISANFGNMVSMALATPFLPFLPLTATQILLNNFLSDLPAIALSADRVESSQLRRPRAWKMASLRRFMLVFGLTSSVFDLITFAVLLWVLSADEAVFRTAWFQVSLLTELAVVLVLRSREPAWESPPAPMLGGALLAVALVALALPYTGPLAVWLGFVPLSLGVSSAVAAIVVTYAASTELVKRFGLAKVPP